MLLKKLKRGSMKHFSRIFLFALALAISGCSTNKLIAPQSLFGAPSDASSAAGFADTSGNVNCASVPLTADSSIPSEFMQFGILSYCYYKTSDPATTSGQSNQIKFIDKGISLADQSCDVFFSQMEAQRLGVSYAQSNTNIAGSAILAALSISTDRTRAIFNMATLLTASNAFFESYKSNYILTPQLQKLHDKIQVGLKNPLAAQMKVKSENHGYRTFDDAKRDLLQYDRLCSHAVLQDIVTDSVAKSELSLFEPVAVPALDKPSKEALALIDRIYQIATKNGAGQFGPVEFEKLYAVVKVDDEAERQASAKALKALDAKLAPFIDNLKLETGSDNEIASTRVLFLKAATLLKLDNSRDVLAASKTIAEQVLAEKDKPAVPAATPGPAPMTMSPALVLYNNAVSERKKALSDLAKSPAPTEVSPAAPISFGYKVKGAVN